MTKYERKCSIVMLSEHLSSLSFLCSIFCFLYSVLYIIVFSVCPFSPGHAIVCPGIYVF